MCGLVGMAGDLGSNYKKVFEELLSVDVVRGPHSTGVAGVTRQGNHTDLVKSVGPPPVLFLSSDYQGMMRSQLKCLIGHNRYATVGKVSEENAHPFNFEKVVGAHNGTLDNWTKKKLTDYDTFGTDSEAIYANINKFGVIPTLDIIVGDKWAKNAWALTWYDKQTDTMNMVKNDERPLHYCYSEDECTLFWASELGMLQWILRRNGVKVADGSWYNVLNDTHYSWKIPKGTNDKFKKPIQTKHVPPPPKEPEVTTFHYNHNQSNVRHYSGPHSNWTPPFTISRSAKTDTKKFRPPYLKPGSPNGLKKEVIFEMVKDGCIFCNNFDSETFKWGDFIQPLKEDMNGRPLFLCEECYNDDDIRKSCQDLL